jgi:putative membrane protein
MFAFLVHLILTAALLLVVARIVNGVQVQGWAPALLAALLLGIVNAIVRPLMVFLTFPLTIITLGLFLFVINALMLWLTAALVPGFRITGFGPALLASLLLTLLNVLIGMLIGPV